MPPIVIKTVDEEKIDKLIPPVIWRRVHFCLRAEVYLVYTLNHSIMVAQQCSLKCSYALFEFD